MFSPLQTKIMHIFQFNNQWYVNDQEVLTPISNEQSQRLAEEYNIPEKEEPSQWEKIMLSDNCDLDSNYND